MSTRVVVPAARGSRVDEQRGLVGPEGHRRVGMYVCRRQGRAVDVDSGRDVDRDDVRLLIVDPRQPVGSLAAQSRARADAEDGVEAPPLAGRRDHDLRACGRGGGEPGGVDLGLVEEAQVDPHPRDPGGAWRRRAHRRRCCPEPTRHHHDLAGRDDVEVVGEAPRGSLHQLTVGKRGRNGRFGGTDVADRVRTQHSATTKAVATLVSCEIDRWAVAMPSSLARSSAAP